MVHEVLQGGAGFIFYLGEVVDDDGDKVTVSLS